MPRKVAPLLPSTDTLLRQLGERLRLARLRRRLSAKQVAARAGMAPMTLRSVERGGSGVTMGAYAAVMQVLGVEKDLDLLVKADPTGRALQDARLSAPRTAAKREPPREQPSTPVSRGKMSRSTIDKAPNRADTSRFTRARDLAALLEAPATAAARAKRR